MKKKLDKFLEMTFKEQSDFLISESKRLLNVAHYYYSENKPLAQFISLCYEYDNEGYDLRILPHLREIMDDLVCHYKLSEEFLNKYEGLISWKRISQYQTLSEQYMRKHINELDIIQLCYHQTLSEQFIRDQFDRLDTTCWSLISENSHSNLSEEFFREFKDYLQWDFIGECQPITKEFLREFADDISYGNFKCNIRQLIEKDNMSEFLLKDEDNLTNTIENKLYYNSVGDVIFNRPQITF